MLVVGLTGGIGAGKTTVAELFAAHGVPIIDTDIIARKLTEPNTDAFIAIQKHFPKILTPEGRLDRPQLRKIIFTDNKQRAWLENLLHPLIRKEVNEQIQQLQAPYCIVVIPLLFEVEFYSSINRILVVDAPEQLQIARVQQRDGSDVAQVTAIINAQARREDRLARTHDVINNSGTEAELIAQVDKLNQMYLKMSKPTHTT